jgi:hypothetical protein
VVRHLLKIQYGCGTCFDLGRQIATRSIPTGLLEVTVASLILPEALNGPTYRFRRDAKPNFSPPIVGWTRSVHDTTKPWPGFLQDPIHNILANQYLFQRTWLRRSPVARRRPDGRPRCSAIHRVAAPSIETSLTGQRRRRSLPTSTIRSTPWPRRCGALSGTARRQEDLAFILIDQHRVGGRDKRPVFDAPTIAEHL